MSVPFSSPVKLCSLVIQPNRSSPENSCWWRRTWHDLDEKQVERHSAVYKFHISPLHTFINWPALLIRSSMLAPCISDMVMSCGLLALNACWAHFTPRMPDVIVAICGVCCWISSITLVPLCLSLQFHVTGGRAFTGGTENQVQILQLHLCTDFHHDEDRNWSL